MKLTHLLAATLLLTGIAQAQTRVTPCSATTANNAICVSITPATKNDLGANLTQPPIFRIDQQRGSGAFATIASNITATTYLVSGLAPGDYVFRIYQSCVSVPNVVTCVESGGVNTGSRNVAVPIEQPANPVVIIAATIRADGPPIYRIIQSVNLRPNEVVFAAPASMRSVFAAR
jgi:hypothetical protein